MRTVVNISLPEVLAKEVEREVRKGKFASKSEFFRHVLRERALIKRLERSQKEFAAGKGKLFTSLRDLR